MRVHAKKCEWLFACTADTEGNFSITISSIPYAYLTATATDPVDGTSEFSDVFVATIVQKVFFPLIVVK